MSNQIYDLELKSEDGAWAIWGSVKGLENANNFMFAKLWAMACNKIPWAEIRKTRRQPSD